jgi:hypothetical protein
MESGQTFSFSAFTLNEQKGTGGQLLEYREARWLKSEVKQEVDHYVVAIVQGHKIKQPIEPVQKNPNHNFHSTRNVRILADGHPTNLIIKIHIDLMVVFNDRKVILP